MCGVECPFVAAAVWLHACPGRLSPQPELVTVCCRRYTSPDEQAFYPNEVPPLVLPPIQYAQVGHFNFESPAPTARRCPFAPLLYGAGSMLPTGICTSCCIR